MANHLKEFINNTVQDFISENNENLNDNFWKWFGNSYVKKGSEPLIVYHGTPDKEFNTFDPSKPKLHRKSEDIGGIYFTSNQMVAGNYRNGGRIIPVYLKIENPLDITPIIAKFRKKGLNFMESKLKALEMLDKTIHDGVIFNGNAYNNPEYVVFNPNQIKSIKNDGTWDLNDANIYS